MFNRKMRFENLQSVNSYWDWRDRSSERIDLKLALNEDRQQRSEENAMNKQTNKQTNKKYNFIDKTEHPHKIQQCSKYLYYIS